MIKKKKVSERKNKNYKNYVQTPIFDIEIQNATIWLNKGEEGGHSATSGRDK